LRVAEVREVIDATSPGVGLTENVRETVAMACVYPFLPDLTHATVDQRPGNAPAHKRFARNQIVMQL
jgi:hypothetical protein